MNTRLSLFDHPFFLGFDQLEREFDRIKKSTEGYPPYNVEQIAEDKMRITLAVAGFTMEDLDIELEHNQLSIKGKQTDDGERVFLHRGIAARQFQKNFVLADGIEVKGAHLDNGLLHIDMQRVMPESNARKIEIRNGAGAHNINGAVDVEVNTKNSGKGK